MRNSLKSNEFHTGREKESFEVSKDFREPESKFYRRSDLVFRFGVLGDDFLFVKQFKRGHKHADPSPGYESREEIRNDSSCMEEKADRIGAHAAACGSHSELPLRWLFVRGEDTESDW